MRRRSWPLVAFFAVACSAVFAQDPAPQPAPQPPPPPAVPPPAVPQPPAQPSQQQRAARPGTEEGFFRPAADPAINPPPVPLGAAAVRRPEPAPLAPEIARAFAAQIEAREALERDLDRAQREAARAQAEAAARRPPPLIVSPLDGTAPIISPLDR
jgi:hypothetical protein